MNITTADFSFALPPELIAQAPATPRDQSRLMVLDRATRRIEHRSFADLPVYLEPGDVLVVNRSKVIPARLRTRKTSGGQVELLLVRPGSQNEWTALARHSRRLKPGMRLTVPDSSLRLDLIEARGDGEWLVKVEAEGSVQEELQRVGTLPLPPYINSGHASPERYQTVYADQDGSIAAPTAGLHFTPELLDEVRARGVETAFVTLHVGLGTFRPVNVERIEDHRMHAEVGEITAETALAINTARLGGGRLTSVGTTTTRLLETAAADDGSVSAWSGETDRFIYPGYRFRTIDSLVTNFHLPRSTLLMLVSAFAGLDFVMEAYQEAIRARYRFYSFGDAMLIL